MSECFVYFAYGSNMLRERLVARCASARPLGIAMVNAPFELVFCKRSVDGSGKAALLPVGDDGVSAPVCGVLYQLDVCDRQSLDRVEGDGYHPETIAV